MQISFLGDAGELLDEAALHKIGVLTDHLDLEDHQGPLDALKTRGGYSTQDEVALRPSTEGLEAICAKFALEHLHTEDEVRVVLEGEGVFEIRDDEDRWIRVLVEPGDLIVVPAKRHHRFFLTERKEIRCVRLFQDPSGWTPIYRSEERQ